MNAERFYVHHQQSDKRDMLSTLTLAMALFDRQQRRRFLALQFCLLAMGVSELVGLATVLPFFAVLADPGVIERRPELAWAFETFGFADTFVFLQWLGGTLFVLVLLSIAVRALTHYLLTRFVRTTAMELAHSLLAHYLSHPYEWFLHRHSADLGKSVLREANEVVLGSISPMLHVMANGLVLILIAGLLFAVEPVGTLVMLACLGSAFGLFYGRLRPFLGRIGEDRRQAHRERHQAAGEAISAIKEVKVLGLERAYLERFAGPSRRLARHHAALALVSEMPRFALEALAFGGMMVFTLWLMASRDGSLAETLPVLGAFAFAGIRLMPVAQTLFADIAKMRFGLPALEGLCRDLAEAPSALAAPPGTGRLRLRRELVLENVGFRYQGAPRPALTGISVRIRAGESVGFAGPSGAGKTTLLDIVLGLVSPQEGRLLVDGVPLAPGDLRAWQRGLGYVPQSISLVDDTIAGNIAFGLEPSEIDREAVERAARLANLHGFVEGLPAGYDTVVGEAGVRLSGGQRQRIGIARALYRDPEVVVFDEATSALDTVTERAVVEAIRTLRGQKTILMVTHRLATVARCDRICLLRDGRLEAEGDFARLSAESDTFRAMLGADA